MNDREFRAMLQASRQRNRYNSSTLHRHPHPATKYPTWVHQSRTQRHWRSNSGHYTEESLYANQKEHEEHY